MAVWPPPAAPARPCPIFFCARVQQRLHHSQVAVARSTPNQTLSSIAAVVRFRPVREQEARILSPALFADVVQRRVNVSIMHGQQPLLALHAARGQVELEHEIVGDAGRDAPLLALGLGQPAAAARLPAGVLKAAA